MLFRDFTIEQMRWKAHLMILLLCGSVNGVSLVVVLSEAQGFSSLG